jgi:hypothetical protein
MGDVMRIYSFSLLLIGFSMLTACDRLGIPDPVKDAAIKEADARATGSACRHAGRGIEDCYTLNPDAARAAVYAGWKDMNDYMRENKIEEVKPSLAVASHASASASDSASVSMSASASSSAGAAASSASSASSTSSAPSASASGH